MSEKEKVKIYIDGSNIYHAQKKLGWSINWRKLLDLIGRDCDILECRYYVGLKDNDDSMQGFLKFLGRLSIRVITKPFNIIKISMADIRSGLEEEKWIFKANFDVEITADVLLGMDSVKKVIIFSGDSDFIYLADKIREQGRSVEFYTSKKTIAWEIRKKSRSRVNYLEDLEVDIKLK